MGELIKIVTGSPCLKHKIRPVEGMRMVETLVEHAATVVLSNARGSWMLKEITGHTGARTLHCMGSGGKELTLH